MFQKRCFNLNMILTTLFLLVDPNHQAPILQCVCDFLRWQRHTTRKRCWAANKWRYVRQNWFLASLTVLSAWDGNPRNDHYWLGNRNPIILHSHHYCLPKVGNKRKHLLVLPRNIYHQHCWSWFLLLITSHHYLMLVRSQSRMQTNVLTTGNGFWRLKLTVYWTKNELSTNKGHPRW